MLSFITYNITYILYLCQDIIYVRGWWLMTKKLQITKKTNLKGNDGYKTFSIRVKEDVVDRLDYISGKTNRSRNELINLLLEFGIENCEIIE